MKFSFPTLVAHFLFVILISGCASTTASRLRENPEAVVALTPREKTTIEHGNIEVGYTSQMVYLALGSPSTKTESETSEGKITTCIYRNYYAPDAVIYAAPKMGKGELPKAAGSDSSWGAGLPSDGGAHGDVINPHTNSPAYKGGGDGPDRVVTNLVVTFLDGKVLRFKVDHLASSASEEISSHPTKLSGNRGRDAGIPPPLIPSIGDPASIDQPGLTELPTFHPRRLTDTAPSPGLQRESATGARVIELPPYVVKDDKPGPPWRYVSLPGLEILSRCLDATTLDLIARNDRQRKLLEIILPPQFQVKLDVPATFVFYSRDLQPAVAQSLISQLQNQEVGNPATTNSSKRNLSVKFLSNYHFWDQDSYAIFFVVDETVYRSGRLRLTSNYLRYLLEARTPTLPTWFVEGMLELYETVSLETGSQAGAEGFTAKGVPTLGFQLNEFTGTAGIDPIIFAPARWVSKEQTERLRKDPALRPEMMKLPALFSEMTPFTSDLDGVLRWRSQAALFIRWALDGDIASRREALWKFVELSSIRSTDEATFRSCFGLSYQDMERQLHDYLPGALRHAVLLHRDLLPDPPQATIRNATEAEISRLTGDLNRLEIGYVSEAYPQVRQHYVEQARRTLHRAYDHGERDARLLAIMGLCECDAGDDDAAIPYLKDATQLGVVRPRAYYELARILAKQQRRTNPSGDPTIGQVNQILHLLLTARRQAPPLPEVYALIAEIFLRSDIEPTAEVLSVLDEGVRSFPRSVKLITATAILYAKNGRSAESRSLIERGLQLPNSESGSNHLRKLQAALGER